MYYRKEEHEKDRTTIVMPIEYEVCIYQCDDESLQYDSSVFTIFHGEERRECEYIPEGKADKSCRHEVLLIGHERYLCIDFLTQYFTVAILLLLSEYYTYELSAYSHTGDDV